ncbi:hypothetical protein ACI8AC_24440 [Geodermatophilus sp. SYSU D00758]
MSERVTWEDCPVCRRVAAVGWSSVRPVEFDCPNGCSPSAEQIRVLAGRQGRAPREWSANP